MKILVVPDGAIKVRPDRANQLFYDWRQIQERCYIPTKG